MSETAVDLYGLSKCKVLDDSGHEIAVGSLWEKQKVVLVFLRHFACIACRAHAVQVWQHRNRYEENGAKLVFIGNGEAQYIEGFKADLGLGEATIYTDPTLLVFQYSGLKRNLFNLVSVGSAANAVRLFKQGHRQTQLGAQGDHLQLGGVLVVTPDNRVAFHFVSKALGDHPDSASLPEK